MPPLLFAGLVALMLVSRRRRLTARWVAFAAGVAIVVGVVLKFV